MNTVTFTRVADGVSKRSYADWGLLLRPKNVPSPEPKIIMMQIEGRDGDIDLTEWAGEVRYNNRAFPLSFYMSDPVPDVTAKATEIKNWMHGQRVKITFSEDAEYYFLARVSVPDAHIEGGVGMLTVNVIAEPYKCKQGKTVATYAVDGSTTVALQNDRMTTRPKITTDGAFSITKYGRNLVPVFGSSTSEGVKFTADGQGGCTATGTSTGTAYKIFASYNLQPGTYTVSGFPVGTTSTFAGYVYIHETGDTYYALTGGRTFTLEAASEVSVRFRVMNGVTANGVYFKPQLEAGDTATEYAPFTMTTYTAGQAGAYEWPDFVFADGYNVVGLSGTGNIQFEWQEGAL